MTSGGQLGPDGQPLAPATDDDDDDDDFDSRSTGSGVPIIRRSGFAPSYVGMSADNGLTSADFMHHVTGSERSAVEAALLHRAMACGLTSHPLDGTADTSSGPDMVHSIYNGGSGSSSESIAWPGSVAAGLSPFNTRLHFYPQSAAMLHPGSLTGGVASAQLSL